MTVRNRSAFVANLLYFVAAYGLAIVPKIFASVLQPNGSFAAYVLQVIVGTLVIFVLPGIAALAMRGQRDMAPRLRMKFSPILLLVIPVAVVGCFLVTGVGAMWEGVLVFFGIGDSTALYAGDTGPLLPDLLLSAMVPALCEEFLFRGIMLPSYKTYFNNTRAAVWVSGLLFGVLHGQPYDLVAHILMGVIFGFVVTVTDSLWAGILYHMTHNTVATMANHYGVWFSTAPAETPLHTVLFTDGFLWAAAGGILFLCFWKVFRILCEPDHLAEARASHTDRIPEADLPPRGNRKLLWMPILCCLPIIVYNYVSRLILP